MDSLHQELNGADRTAQRLMDTVSDAAESAVARGRRLAGDATDGAKRAAEYLQDSDASEVGSRVKDYLKANPSHAVIGAAFVGFVVGRMMSRR